MTQTNGPKRHLPVFQALLITLGMVIRNAAEKFCTAISR